MLDREIIAPRRWMIATLLFGISLSACAHSADAFVQSEIESKQEATIAEAIKGARDCADATSGDEFDATVLTDRGWRGIMEQMDGPTVLYAPPESIDGVSISAPKEINGASNGYVISDSFDDDAFFHELKMRFSSTFSSPQNETMRIGRDFVEVGEETRTNSRGSRRFFVVSVYETGDVE